jgi:DNA-directed RNA polymerase subunit RPC12/RpoP
MSLWSQSLTESICDAQDPTQRAKVIFEYLAMDVPRSWWQPYLVRGKPRKDHVQMLSGLFNDLKEFPKLQGRISYSLLVAMSFLDQKAKPSFGIQPNQQSIDQYIAAAEKVLAERPDVRRLGKVVTKMANTLQESKLLQPKVTPRGRNGNSDSRQLGMRFSKLEGGNMAKFTCPKCNMELNEILYVDESVMEFVEGDDYYMPWKSIRSITKCPRCGTILEQFQEPTKAKIACPNCRMKLDIGIGVVEAVMEYDQKEEAYLHGKDVSLPKITRCLNCGADLRNINVGNLK